MNLADLKLKAISETERHIKEGAKRLGIEPFSVPISFDLKGGTAGKAYSTIFTKTDRVQPDAIKYNAALMERHPEDFLTRTVPHEVAHLLAGVCYGASIKPHGHEWKSVMRMLGADPSRCHSYDVEGIKKKKSRFRHLYTCLKGCPNERHFITTVKHSKIVKNKARYVCNSCRQEIKSTGKKVDINKEGSL